MRGVILPRRRNRGLLVEVSGVGWLPEILKVCLKSRFTISLVGRSAESVL